LLVTRNGCGGVLRVHVVLICRLGRLGLLLLRLLSSWRSCGCGGRRLPFTLLT
jgi:hypothetical protein